jgi:hypothetical protein
MKQASKQRERERERERERKRETLAWRTQPISQTNKQTKAIAQIQNSKTH